MLKLAAIFKDHMVVQREKPVVVFGTGNPGEKVNISLYTSQSEAIVNSDGTWRTALEPLYIADGEEDDGRWACQREQQMFASKMISNSGMVSLTDCGEFDNIHPLDKKTPGERLALLAENMVYEHKEINTPTVEHIYSDGKKLYVSFSGSSELILRDTNKNTFEIADANDVFHPAKVKILRENLLCAECENVEHPQSLRYAWYNFGEAALFDKIGNAVSPFRIKL